MKEGEAKGWIRGRRPDAVTKVVISRGAADAFETLAVDVPFLRTLGRRPRLAVCFLQHSPPFFAAHEVNVHCGRHSPLEFVRNGYFDGMRHVAWPVRSANAAPAGLQRRIAPSLSMLRAVRNRLAIRPIASSTFHDKTSRIRCSLSISFFTDVRQNRSLSASVERSDLRIADTASRAASGRGRLCIAWAGTRHWSERGRTDRTQPFRRAGGCGVDREPRRIATVGGEPSALTKRTGVATHSARFFRSRPFPHRRRFRSCGRARRVGRRRSAGSATRPRCCGSAAIRRCSWDRSRRGWRWWGRGRRG